MTISFYQDIFSTVNFYKIGKSQDMPSSIKNLIQIHLPTQKSSSYSI